MVGRVKVLRRVTVLRVVAAADVSALQAEPKVDPAVTDGKAVFAPGTRARAWIARREQVLTLGRFGGHADRLSLSMANKTFAAGRHAARSSTTCEPVNGTRSFRSLER